MSQLKPIIHHGVLQLAQNSFISNCEIEALQTDPDVHRIGRIWFNIPEKVFKYSGLDSNNNLIICIFGGNYELSAFVNSLQASTGTNLIGFQGNSINQNFLVPADTLTNTLNLMIGEISNSIACCAVEEYFIVDEFIVTEQGVAIDSIFKNIILTSLQSNVNYTLDSFENGLLTSAKFLIELQSNDNCESIEFEVLYNGIDTYNLQVGLSLLANIDSIIDNNQIIITITPNVNQLNVKALRTSLVTKFIQDSKIIANIISRTDQNQFILDSFPIETINSVKYFIEASSDQNFEMIEMIVLHDNVQVLNSQYGNMRTQSNVINVNAIIENNIVKILVDPLLPNINIKFVKIPIDNIVSTHGLSNLIVDTNNSIIDSFNILQIKTKKYLIEAISGVNQIVTELLVTYDNLNIEMIQYGIIEIGSELLTFNATQTDNIVTISYNSIFNDIQFKIIQIELIAPEVQSISNNDFQLSTNIDNLDKLTVNVNGMEQSKTVYNIVNSNILHFDIPLYLTDVVHARLLK